jgi:hypothetical protein
VLERLAPFAEHLKSRLFLFRHSGESRNPGFACFHPTRHPWMPACAGMTGTSLDLKATDFNYPEGDN